MHMHMSVVLEDKNFEPSNGDIASLIASSEYKISPTPTQVPRYTSWNLNCIPTF